MMASPYRLTDTVYMTAGIKKQLLKHSEEIRNALNRFKSGDFGNLSEKVINTLIDKFGSYELSFGTVWIINYNFFSDRDFITLLLPEEFEGEKYQNSHTHFNDLDRFSVDK